MARRHDRSDRKDGLSRRDLLRLAGAGAGFSLLGMLKDARPALGAASSSTLTIGGAGFDIKTLDPGRELENGANNIDHATYDSLVTFEGEDLRTPKPSLATGWTVSQDGKTYTFKLRPNVKFASGNPLTSADFKWSIDRVRYLKGNAAFLLEGLDEVQTPDPLTVVIRMTEPHPAILPILSSPVLSAVDSKLVAANGGDASPDARTKDQAEAYLNAHSAGTGAFMLQSYTPKQEIVLVKNPNHWRGAPRIDRVVLRNVAEPSAQELMIKKGDLDVATGIGADQVRSLAGVPGVTVKTSLASTLVYVMMNQNPQVGGPFANPKVVQAVRAALDYQGMLALAGKGALRQAGIIPNNFPGALPAAEAARTDREHAKRLLREANLGEISGSLTFASDLVFYGIQANLIAQKVQEDLGAVGIKINLNGLPYSVAIQQYRDGKNQLGIWQWAADYPDVSDYLVFVPGRTVAKRTGWMPDASAEAQQITQLAKTTETEINTAKRVALYQRLNRMIASYGPWAPLFQPVTPYAFRSNVRGVTFASAWMVDYYTVSKT
ncbi:MAG TPA: ABC transporter substrate-binding protein [bacterium]|nr:ABC transporter substrate-binding protein [bacterium]